MELDEEFKLLLAQLKHYVKLLLPGEYIILTDAYSYGPSYVRARIIRYIVPSLTEERLRITVWLKKLLEAVQRSTLVYVYHSDSLIYCI